MERAQDTMRAIRVTRGGLTLDGDLGIPANAGGVVLFAHGSGSSRHSPRNRRVAEILRRSGFATLLLDLLTVAEERRDMVTAHLRFDIGLLADRLDLATDWLRRNRDTAALPIGYFGASTGAAAALVASVRWPHDVRAIVSRGGRPDLADDFLSRVVAPTLLVVGGEDTQVIGMNQTAFMKLHGEKRLVIVPGATHLFEEPGALDEVAQLATEWFASNLARVPAEPA